MINYQMSKPWLLLNLYIPYTYLGGRKLLSVLDMDNDLYEIRHPRTGFRTKATDKDIFQKEQANNQKLPPKENTIKIEKTSE